MTTSDYHHALLEIIQAWCSDKDDANRYLVLCDTETYGNQQPPTIGRYRPDLIWVNGSGKYRFIGEAKTRYDIQTRHSKKQIKAYLEHLDYQKEGELVVAVPWGWEGTARSMISLEQRRAHVEMRRWTVISNAPPNVLKGYDKGNG